ATLKKLLDSKQYKEALDLFDQKFEICTDFTIDMAIKACTMSNDYKRGFNIQKRLSSNSLNNPFIQVSLIRLYMQYGDVDSATRLFSSTANKSNYIYTAMFKGLISNNMAEKVFDLLDEMEVKPDSFTLAILFKACAELANDRAIKIGRKLLDEMPENYRNNNNAVLNSAMHMLMKFGDIQRYVENKMFEKALDIFEQIHLNFDSVTYTVVFNACAGLANDRAIKIGQKLFDEMPENYRNDNVVLSSALHMLMKFGDIQNAERIFRSNKKKDIITYNALINGYNLNDESSKCFKILEEMRHEGIVPNDITWNILIGACSQIGMIHRCEYIIDRIPLDIQNKRQIQNSLIDMRGKCGSVEKAQIAFKSIDDRDTVTYNTMINAFGLNGMGSEAIQLYKQMPNYLRDEVSHICVLNACSHSGLVHEARNIFDEITFKTEKIITIMQFTAHDNSHPQASEIDSEIGRMTSELIQHGYKFDSSWITREIKDGETIQSVLCGHSEKKAI
ncbi:unnamed protein product, partial [Rotaria magnacalcarata]